MGRTDLDGLAIRAEHIQRFVLPANELTLEHDRRLHGLIKWYVTPLVFGGDPSLGENVIWVNIETHFALVTFWNDKYDEATTAGDQNRRLTSS